MRYIPVVCIGVLLLLTYHLYGYAYFSTDDFNNLYWAQKQNAYQTLVQLLNPMSRAYRPSGMTFYWVLLQLFDLNAAPYHWVAWLLHAINTWLVYLILKEPGGRAGATVGAMLFACQAAFADIYWNFGSIFELLCALGFFVGILLWINRERSWKATLACGLVFLFALKAKEMAITLPVIWILCDFLLRNNRDVLRTLHALLPAAFGIWYGLRKSQELASTTPDGLFYMDVSWITLGRGMGGFFNSLFGANLRWQHWIIGFVFLFLILTFRKNRAALFFQAYFLVTILPVIFLVNHRELYLLYIPFLGLCGLVCLLVKAMATRVESRVGVERASMVASLLFPLLCWGTYVVQKTGSEERRIWQRPMSIDYEAFISELRALPPPMPGEAVFFDSHPINFREEHLRAATEVGWRQTDLDVRLVSTFPVEARYKLHYQNRRLTRIP